MIARYAPGASRSRYFLLSALLAGAALPFAFAPFGWRWIAFASPMILLYLWSEGGARVVALRGFLFGVGVFGVGTYWIYYSLHLFGDAIAPLAIIITIGFVAFFSTYIAAFGWLLARFLAAPESSRGRALWMAVVAPAMWTLCEIFRGWFMTGFPWLSLGYSQIDTALAGYAPILGVYGVSWLVASCAGLGCLVISGNSRTRVTAICTIATLWIGGFLLGKIEWTESNGEPLEIRMVQGNIEQYHKFMADLLVPSIEAYKRLSETPEKVDLIVWPESAIPTFFFRIDEQLQEFVAQKSTEGIKVLTGGFIYDRGADVYYNSLRMLDDHDAYYHKKHLVPFGEFLPLRTLLAFLSEYIVIPMSDLSPGTNGGKGISVNGQLIGASICYEDAFGEELIQQLPAANMLLNVSNDSWFGDSSAPYQHLEIAQMRALEVARPMVRVTNTGVSAAIDYRGRVHSMIEKSQSSAINVTVKPRRGATPYVNFGNTLILLFVFVQLAIGYYMIRHRELRRSAV